MQELTGQFRKDDPNIEFSTRVQPAKSFLDTLHPEKAEGRQKEFHEWEEVLSVEDERLLVLMRKEKKQRTGRTDKLLEWGLGENGAIQGREAEENLFKPDVTLAPGAFTLIHETLICRRNAYGIKP